MTPTQGEHAQTESLAHELFAAAQLAPGEGIEDAVSRIAAALTAPTAQPAAPQGVAYAMHQRVEELIEKESELRRVVEIIALGESANPVIDAGDELVALGYWDAGAVAAMRASHGQAPAQPVALPSDRELQEIAMQAAWRHSLEPDAPKYLPRSPVHAATWKPHAWVVAAMKDAIEAATQPKKDHHDELS